MCYSWVQMVLLTLWSLLRFEHKILSAPFVLNGNNDDVIKTSELCRFQMWNIVWPLTFAIVIIKQDELLKYCFLLAILVWNWSFKFCSSMLTLIVANLGALNKFSCDILENRPVLYLNSVTGPWNIHDCFVLVHVLYRPGWNTYFWQVNHACSRALCFVCIMGCYFQGYRFILYCGLYHVGKNTRYGPQCRYVNRWWQCIISIIIQWKYRLLQIKSRLSVVKLVWSRSGTEF